MADTILGTDNRLIGDKIDAVKTALEGGITASPSQLSVAHNPNAAVLVTNATSGTEIADANTSRKDILIVNMSDDFIYLSLGGTPTSGTGIPLAPAPTSGCGGYWENDKYNGAIRGIRASTSGIVLVTEI